MFTRQKKVLFVTVITITVFYNLLLFECKQNSKVANEQVSTPEQESELEEELEFEQESEFESKPMPIETETVIWTEINVPGSMGPSNWSCITSSSDGMMLAAVKDGGYIYTSIDGGVTWTEQT